MARQHGPAAPARGATGAPRRLGLASVRNLALGLASLCLWTQPAAPQLSLDVNAAIARGAEALRAAQHDDGSFDGLIQFPMGSTALALYTMRKSGLPADDPAVVRALEYLEPLPELKTYSVATYVFALDALNDPAHAARIAELGQWLEQHFDKRRKQWGYPGGEPELSNTQFAVLALAIASRHGHQTAPKFWTHVIDGVLETQLRGGGFRYSENMLPEASGSMAAAGITTLHVAREQLAAAGQYESHQLKADEAIERSWQWLDERYASSGGPVGDHGLAGDRFPIYERGDWFHYYYLFGIERVATLSRRKTIGGLPWYRQGALELLAHESPEGGWGSLPNTCFALLFLRRVTISGGASPAAESAGSAPIRSATRTSDETGPFVPTWAYTTEEPPKGWTKSNFDDSDWARGRGGFGVGAGSGLVVRTPWTGSELWVRRSFRWSPDEVLDLRAFHQGTVSIWINAVKAGKGEMWSLKQYRAFPLDKAVLRSLHPGENVIAAHIQGPPGQSSLDIHLDGPPEEVTSAHWRDSLPRPDVPFVRRWLVSGPHADKGGQRMLASAAPAEHARAEEALDGEPWRAVTSRPGRLDLGALAGLKAKSFGYLATWVHTEQAWEGYLWLGSDGGVRAWIDGQAVAHLHEHRPAEATALRAPLKLKPGAHLLIVGVEAVAGPPVVFVRLAGTNGDVPHGLRFSLSPDADDMPSDAAAHPALYDLPTLAAVLPITAPGALAMTREDELAQLAFTAEGETPAAWYAKTPGRGPEPRPPSGARGVLGLTPPTTGTPIRVLLRVLIQEDAQHVAVRVARSAGSLGSARLRLGVVDRAALAAQPEGATADGHGSTAGAAADDEPRWLVPATELSGKVSSRHAWQDIEAPLGPLVGRDVLLILEVAAVRGAPPETIFVDQFELR